MGRLRRIVQEREGDSGFSRWVRPRMASYIMVCCDCGLAHEMQFNVMRITARRKDGSYTGEILPRRQHRVMFRARRAPRYTAKVRARK